MKSEKFRRQVEILRTSSIKMTLEGVGDYHTASIEVMRSMLSHIEKLEKGKEYVN